MLFILTFIITIFFKYFTSGWAIYNDNITRSVTSMVPSLIKIDLIILNIAFLSSVTL